MTAVKLHAEWIVSWLRLLPVLRALLINPEPMIDHGTPKQFFCSSTSVSRFTPMLQAVPEAMDEVGFLSNE